MTPLEGRALSRPRMTHKLGRYGGRPSRAAEGTPYINLCTSVSDWL